MDLDAVADDKYVNLTTFRRDGTPGSTPVWIVDLGSGSVGFTTGADSLKVKRIRNDARVRLQPSDARGRVRAGTEPVDGIAAVVTGDGFERVRAAIAAKYGWQYHLMRAAGRVGRLIGKGDAANCAVVVSPAGPAAP